MDDKVKNAFDMLPPENATKDEREQLCNYMKLHDETYESIAHDKPRFISKENVNYHSFSILATHEFLRMYPENGFNWYFLVDALWSAGRIDDAIAACKALVATEFQFLSYSDDPYFKIGIIEAIRGNGANALYAFREAKNRHSGQRDRVAFYFGVANHLLGNFSVATAHYHEFLRGLDVLKQEESLLDPEERGGMEIERIRPLVETYISEAEKGKLFSADLKDDLLGGVTTHRL